MGSLWCAAGAQEASLCSASGARFRVTAADTGTVAVKEGAYVDGWTNSAVVIFLR